MFWVNLTLIVATILAALVPLTSAMNIALCDNNDGYHLVPDMNGFKVFVDDYTLAILDDPSSSLDESGTERTYGECIAHGTNEARTRLASRSVSDGPFVHALSKGKARAKRKQHTTL